MYRVSCIFDTRNDIHEILLVDTREYTSFKPLYEIHEKILDTRFSGRDNFITGMYCTDVQLIILRCTCTLRVQSIGMHCTVYSTQTKLM